MKWVKSIILSSVLVISILFIPNLLFAADITMYCRVSGGSSTYPYDTYAKAFNGVSDISAKIAERNGGGAAAVFASSGFTRTLGQVDMHACLLGRYFAGEKCVGVLADEARSHVFARGEYYAPLVKTWVLLADPAMQLK